MRLDAIGVLFANSWKRLRENFAVAAQIYAVPLVLIFISQLLVERNTLPAVALGGFIQLLAALISVPASLALISLFGKGTDFAASYRTGFSLFWAAVWIGILAFLAVIGGAVMLIIPGIMLAIQLSLTNYALVLDGKHGIDALAQSREYVKGYWWALVGRMVLLMLCLGAFALIFLLPTTLLLGFVVGRIVYAIMLLIFVPFSISYQYEIFENFRRLKPDVAEAAMKAERGFLKVSMVVGIIGGVLFIVLGILAFGFLIAAVMNPNPLKYPGGYPDWTTSGIATSTSALKIWPDSGAVGDRGYIDGANFDATNTILMNGLVAERNVAPNDDGSLTLTIPKSLGPNCDPNKMCPQFLEKIMPGSYEVTVLNSQGTSSAGMFTVTSDSPAQSY